MPTVRELKCAVCGSYVRQTANAGGSFDKIEKCAKCGSTRIWTARVYQTDK
jgi:hypothetical protein